LPVAFISRLPALPLPRLSDEIRALLDRVREPVSMETLPALPLLPVCALVLIVPPLERLRDPVDTVMLPAVPEA
jgi:hypothetical protein